jgi:hypothetical protein
MKKTSLQTIINELQEQTNELPTNLYSYHCLMAVIDIVKSQLEKEKQDLIEAHFEGQKECSNEFAMESDARLYFKQTFEQSN